MKHKPLNKRQIIYLSYINQFVHTLNKSNDFTSPTILSDLSNDLSETIFSNDEIDKTISTATNIKNTLLSLS